jgi:hypothetical protein
MSETESLVLLHLVLERRVKPVKLILQNAYPFATKSFKRPSKQNDSRF